MSAAGVALGRVLLTSAVAIVCLADSACGASGSSGSSGESPAVGAAALAQALAAEAHDVEVQGEGVVEKVLSDDEDGNRHQRFILKLASGQTLLVAHNIDVAPRVEGLQPGDTVASAASTSGAPRGLLRPLDAPRPRRPAHTGLVAPRRDPVRLIS